MKYIWPISGEDDTLVLYLYHLDNGEVGSIGRDAIFSYLHEKMATKILSMGGKRLRETSENSITKRRDNFKWLYQQKGLSNYAKTKTGKVYTRWQGREFSELEDECKRILQPE